MKTNLNGIGELTADDLDRVSGGNVLIDYVVGKAIESVFFVDAVRKTATGTLKGIQKPAK